MNEADRQSMTHQIKLLVTVTILKGSQVTYVHLDKGPDNESGLFLPNDVLNKGEDPYAAAKRVAKEQANIDVADLKLVDVDSFEGRDGSWHVALHFKGAAPAEATLKAAAGLSLMMVNGTALPADNQVAYGGWFNSVAKRALQQA